MTRNTVRIALLGATVLAGAAGIAAAQVASPYDPDQLPAFQGKVAQYDLTPRGDVDGLILQDGTEVHFPPHLGLQVVAAVRPGDAVTIHGLKARALPLIMAMSVSNDASHQTIIDTGPRGPGGGPGGPGGPGEHPMHPRPPQPWGGLGGERMDVQGVVKQALYGPRGDMNGVLLADGTMVHLPPREAAKLADLLKPGQTVAAHGEGVAIDLGKSLEARAIGPSPEKLTPVAMRWEGHHPPPPGGPGAPPPDPASAP